MVRIVVLDLQLRVLELKLDEAVLQPLDPRVADLRHRRDQIAPLQRQVLLDRRETSLEGLEIRLHRVVLDLRVRHAAENLL